MKLDKVNIWIVIAIFTTATGLLFPILGSTFSPYYANIAKNIVLSNNWIDLVQSNKDWLDKPHFPFWMTALSFKLLGIKSFAYILPGFIFHMIGAYYTYKLSNIWYTKKTSLTAVLLYLTSLHLMLSSTDVRAEAYLLGEITPACYYFLLYNKNKHFKYLIFGAFFSGLALMTKGIFVLVTITSGLICIWIAKKKLILNLLNFRWWLAILIAFIFTAPEIISLYVQFDLHPEKIVFGASHTSGIKWFFWDSQFGRFFNTGPIATTSPLPYHWLFFIHTFLWAFLPWWPIFVGAIITAIKNRINKLPMKEENIFLYSSFFITFVLFSATSFQVDHYTNIIFPFACIICANWLIKAVESDIESIKWLIYIEVLFSILFLITTLIISYLIFGYLIAIIVAVTIITLSTIVIAIYNTKKFFLLTIYPIYSILILFIIIICINGIYYKKYDAGYNIAKILNKLDGKIIGYQMDDMPLKSLDFYSKNRYTHVDQITKLTIPKNTRYIVAPTQKLRDIKREYPYLRVIYTIKGCEIGTFLSNISNLSKLEKKLHEYAIIELK